MKADSKERGARLRALRLAHDLSVAELAERTGYSAKHIWNVEAGRKQASAGMLWYIEHQLKEQERK